VIGCTLAPVMSMSKYSAFAVLLIGFLTFFEPLVRIEPPVLGTAKWSAT
jgi:hypothetical protein